MVAFLSKNWFYIGLALLGLVYFRKELRNYVGVDAVRRTQVTDSNTENNATAALGVPSVQTTMVGIFPEVDEEVERVFLTRFSKVVQTEQGKFGIPASVLLALAYVNSFAGKRALSRTHFNYFALPCGAGWDGRKVEIGSYCYRKYETAWESFRNASSSISATRWAQELIEANADSVDWVNGLVKYGYSDVRDADRLMVSVIQRYKLKELDIRQVP